MSYKVSSAKRRKANELYERGKSRREISTKLQISYPMVWMITNPETKHFETYNQYIESLRAKAGCNSAREHQERIAQRRGYSSIEDYLEELREDRECNKKLRKIVESEQEYKKLLTEKRSNKKRNQLLRSFMERGMKRTKKSISDLWRETGISKQMVSQYVQGNSIPNEERLTKLLQAFGMPSSSFKELLYKQDKI